MKIEIADGAASFLLEGRCAGVLKLDDPFKPYLHPLVTPKGQIMTVCMPADHRHHKGLMYALRCEDLNFWEEDPGSAQCGVQRVIHAEEVAGDSGTGIKMTLLWESESGGMATYEEERSIHARLSDDGQAYIWQFESRRTSLRPHQLIMSQWSHTKQDGTLVNYHGLGFRLPWAWCVAHVRTLEVDGEVCADFVEASGCHPRKVCIRGGLDGTWNPPVASVTLEQPGGQGCALYANGSPFPYLSLGPSNLSAVDVSEGVTFSESFTITLRDLNN